MVNMRRLPPVSVVTALPVTAYSRTPIVVAVGVFSFCENIVAGLHTPAARMMLCD